jgi:hypothetical protein
MQKISSSQISQSKRPKLAASPTVESEEDSGNKTAPQVMMTQSHEENNELNTQSLLEGFVAEREPSQLSS